MLKTAAYRQRKQGQLKKHKNYGISYEKMKLKFGLKCYKMEKCIGKLQSYKFKIYFSVQNKVI